MPLACLCALVVAAPAEAHELYLAIDNHTDYGWNATTAAYDQAMLAELDFFLAGIAASKDAPPAEQVRYVADCWWWLKLYEDHRSPAEFAALLQAIQSGHVTVPLHPFVLLFGAMPTEAVIRAGSYPGRMSRKHGLAFQTAHQMENHTIPWGLATLWAQSGVAYTWKGVCGCATDAPYADRKDEVFRWRGPDGSELLMKWYQLGNGSATWGGYGEARETVTSNDLAGAISYLAPRAPKLGFSGLFGMGWDDVSYTSLELVTRVKAHNAKKAADTARVSNEVDYFERLVAETGGGVALPVEQGGFGNDWDLQPATMAHTTARMRRAAEQLRTAEALLAWAHPYDADFWPTVKLGLDEGWLAYWKYYEHSWSESGVGIDYVIKNKLAWADAFTSAVATALSQAATRVKMLVATPSAPANGAQRVLVWNGLGHLRTDVVDLPGIGPGDVVVTDVASGAVLPSQPLPANGGLRVLVRDVPAVGYRALDVTPGSSSGLAPIATLTGKTVTSDRWKLVIGDRGQLTSAVDLLTGRELGSPGADVGLFDVAGGTGATVVLESSGPVSLVIRVDVEGTPARAIRYTLHREVARVDVSVALLGKPLEPTHVRFEWGLENPAFRFEEVGAVARAGNATQGGDYLAGARTDYVTMNHFAAMTETTAAGAYTAVLGSADAFAAKVGASTAKAFALPSKRLAVLAAGNVAFGGVADQPGGVGLSLGFSLTARPGAFSATTAMRDGLAMQNPLVPMTVPWGQTGPIGAASDSLVRLVHADGSAVDDAEIMAVKPVEEGERGVLVRVWALGGAMTGLLDASRLSPAAAFATNLIETDTGTLTVAGGKIAVTVKDRGFATVRVVGKASEPVGAEVAPEAGAETGAEVVAEAVVATEPMTELVTAPEAVSAPEAEAVAGADGAAETAMEAVTGSSAEAPDVVEGMTAPEGIAASDEPSPAEAASMHQPEPRLDVGAAVAVEISAEVETTSAPVAATQSGGCDLGGRSGRETVALALLAILVMRRRRDRDGAIDYRATSATSPCTIPPTSQVTR